MIKSITPEEGKAAAEKAERTVRELCESAGATFKKIAKELCTVAFSDLRDYITVAEGGEIQAIPLNEIVKRKSRALRKIKEHTQIKESADGSAILKDSRVEYELYDKLDALKYLCRLRGDEPAQRMEVGGKNGGPIRHEHDIGGAIQTVVDRLVGTILRPPTNGTSEKVRTE